MDQTPSLRPGLLRHRLDNELLIYDTKEEQVHLLNPTTFAVVEMLEEGLDSSTIATRLGSQNDTDAGAEILALALDELAKAKLLEKKADISPAIIPDSNRRQMIQRAAALGAALLVPAIVTLTPKTASAASNLPNGSACVRSVECTSGCCGQGNGGTCSNNQCSPNTCGNCAA